MPICIFAAATRDHAGPQLGADHCGADDRHQRHELHLDDGHVDDAWTNVGSAWPTFSVPGIFSSGTTFHILNIDVVVA